MKYFVENTHNGIRAVARPGKELPKEVSNNFMHSVGAYGFLVPLNSRVTCEGWVKLIQDYYQDNARTQRCIESIKIAMDETCEIDLFSTPELLPEPVQDILMEFGEAGSYERCEELLNLLKPHGYTFDYGLDGDPYDLKLIEQD